MRFPLAPIRRRHWLGRGLRLGVVLVVLLGTLLSSLGGLHSHGLKTLAAFGQAGGDHGDGHAHTHESDTHDVDSLVALEGGQHGHLGSDHSHDKAHALPAMPTFAPSPAPGWLPRAPAWAQRLAIRRLERPPKAA